MTANARGMTLLETLIALFMIGIGVLAAAPMFIYAMQGNETGSQFGQTGAMAVDRMELLRSLPYDDSGLLLGGSLTANATVSGANYFDNSDPDYLVRWQVANHPSVPLTKTVTVRAIALNPSVGAQKHVTLTTVRGN